MDMSCYGATPSFDLQVLPVLQSSICCHVMTGYIEIKRYLAINGMVCLLSETALSVSPVRPVNSSHACSSAPRISYTAAFSSTIPHHQILMTGTHSAYMRPLARDQML